MRRKGKRLISICIYLLMVMGCSEKDNIFNESAGEMINIVDLAKEIDKDKFIHYKVVPMPETSKEMIAVVFNTDETYNVGLIDEHGNVLKEPFIKNEDYDYYNTHDGDLVMYSYVGDYLIYGYDVTMDENGNEIYWAYNKKYERVKISKEIYDELCYPYIFKGSERVEGEEINNAGIINKIYGYISDKEKIKIGFVEKAKTNNYYTLNLYKSGFFFSGPGYYLLMDKNFELVNHLYYSQGDENQFYPPTGDTKVGIVFVRELGLVYFNVDGEIIWITYCKEPEK